MDMGSVPVIAMEHVHKFVWSNMWNRRHDWLSIADIQLPCDLWRNSTAAMQSSTMCWCSYSYVSDSSVIWLLLFASPIHE